MPAYYWIQLYKAPSELNVSTIVQRTVDALVDSGCRYQFSQTTIIEDDSLPEEKQRVQRNNVDFDLVEATYYTVKDLEAWQTTEKAKKWLPGIKLFFEFDFHFDEGFAKRFGPEKLKKARQISLNFWLRKDKLFSEKVVISLHPWEEYVLMYGQEKTHSDNKKEILRIVEKVCNYVTPYYGWLDSETSSRDAQYDFMDKDDWTVQNEFVVIGPQLLDKIFRYSLNVFSVLENGCMLLHSSASSQEAG